MLDVLFFVNRTGCYILGRTGVRELAGTIGMSRFVLLQMRGRRACSWARNELKETTCHDRVMNWPM